MRIWIGTGASGGHLYPALAVAREARRRGHEVQILLGGPRRVEIPDFQDLATIHSVSSGPVKGKGPRAVWSLIQVFIGTHQAARWMLRKGRGEVLLASGSYAAAPAILAARILRIPYALMEQNVQPGVAIRRFEAGASVIFLAFQETQQFLTTPRVVWVGNPTLHYPKPLDRIALRRKWHLPTGIPVVLGIGGSQGSRHLTEVLLLASRQLFDTFFIIQTGRFHSLLTEEYKEKGSNYRLVPFIREMAEVYVLADLVVSRAGGGVIAELTNFGKPAILVPFAGAGGHQEWNAKVLVDHGAALMVRDSEWRPEVAISLITQLLKDHERLVKMAQRAQSLAKPNAAQHIVQILEERFA